MFKGLLFSVMFISIMVFGIHKGWHNNIAAFGNSAQPIATTLVNQVEKSIETSKEVTHKVATEVKENTK